MNSMLDHRQRNSSRIELYKQQIFVNTFNARILDQVTPDTGRNLFVR